MLTLKRMELINFQIAERATCLQQLCVKFREMYSLRDKKFKKRERQKQCRIDIIKNLIRESAMNRLTDDFPNEIHEKELSRLVNAILVEIEKYEHT